MTEISFEAPQGKGVRGRAVGVAAKIGWVLLIGFLATSVALFAATKLGLIQQLIVVSGSMEPAIGTGAFVVTRPVAATAVSVGDVVSVPVAGDLPVIHRVTAIEEGPAGKVVLRLKGDANNAPDATPYVVDEVNVPIMVVPQAGRVTSVIQNTTSTLTTNPLLTVTGLAVAAVGWALLRPAPRHRVAS